MLQKFKDDYSTPDIMLAGLQIWAHGREFPDETDYWDANWLDVTALCSAPGAEVWVRGPILHLTDLNRWADDLQQLHDSLQGDADLGWIEPQLIVRIRVGEAIGRIKVEVEISPDISTQTHTFRFELDKSYLSQTIAGLRTLLDRFPVRGHLEGPN